MFKRQRTIKQPVSYVGIGLHTGNRTTITFKPSPINHGIRFVRIDLPNRLEIPADIDHVVNITRGTTIGRDGVQLHTVEHVLAAIAGLELDNVTVEIDGNEPPVGDGSAAPFVEVLLKSGVEQQNSPKDYLQIENPIVYSTTNGDLTRELVVLPSDDFRLTFMIDYKTPVPGSQYTVLFSLEKDFVKGFAPARTFTTLSEVEMLKRQGLIRGGSLENALVIVDRELDPEEMARLKNLFGIQDDVFVEKNGIIGGQSLRFDNEPCRHKALDLVGDLALLGVPLKAHVLAARSGHAANIELVKKIRRVHQKKQLCSKYSAQAKGDFLLDVNAILKILPHRYPFLLIDRVLDLEPLKHVVALKNVTINEPFFSGHFPGHPIMPAVLQLEAMAQAGGILLLNTIAQPENKLVYYTAIDKARFRKPVVPGDQLRFEVEMVRFRSNACKMQGKAFVNDDLVAEAEMMAAVVERDHVGK